MTLNLLLILLGPPVIDYGAKKLRTFGPSSPLPKDDIFLMPKIFYCCCFCCSCISHPFRGIQVAGQRKVPPGVGLYCSLVGQSQQFY